MQKRAHSWSDDEKQWLRDNIDGVHYDELLERFNRAFPEANITKSALRSKCKVLNITNGYTGQFEKGRVPANKGIPMSEEQKEKCKATMFKKGVFPGNLRPVGSERIDADGYVSIKVANPRTWVQKQKWVYEQAYGPLNKDERIIFKDGNPQNCNLDNLMKISSREHVIMNLHHYRSNKVELTELGVNLARLRLAINEKKREKRDKK